MQAMHPSREQDRHMRWPLLVLLAIAAAATIVGRAQLDDFLAPPAPPVAGKWTALLAELREFERRIGFRDTNNFTKVATDRPSYPICGRASNRRLPYSYEDRLIEWPEIEKEEACRDTGAESDVYFSKVEAWGEIGTPVTAAMLASTLDRFVYLVIHEDCHDQFELPYGIEEPLCDVVTHRAMVQFSREKFHWYATENRALRNYARTEAKRVRVTISSYARIEALYQRYERGEIAHAALLELRAREFALAERELRIEAGQLNNIGLANYMTYSRHYPALARIADAWRDDLPGMIEFFRIADARKPPTEVLLKRSGGTDEKSAQFLRLHEAAVLDTIRGIADTPVRSSSAGH